MIATATDSAQDFQLANRAFELMTLAEREAVLKEFARLRYPSIAARFFEAVYVVIGSGSVVGREASGVFGQER